MQIGFSFDQSKCIGCYACAFTCMVERYRQPGIYWRRILWMNSKEPLSFLSLSCLHCAEPPCVDACPQGAIIKREEDGIVIVDEDECLGKDNCGVCKEACPYDVPQFGPGNDSKMSKCDLCFERLEEDRMPYCVQGCPFGAISFGPLPELEAKFKDEKPARGFTYSEEAKPSFTSKEGTARYYKLP